MNLSDIHFFFSRLQPGSMIRTRGREGGGGWGDRGEWRGREKAGEEQHLASLEKKKRKKKNTNLTRDTRAIRIITFKRGKGVRENRAGGAEGEQGGVAETQLFQTGSYLF